MRISDWSSDVCSSDLMAAIRGKTRRKGHVRQVGDQLLRAGADIVDIDARPVSGIAHIDDCLLVWRKARRQHDRLAAGQEAVVRSVLVHARQPLDPPLLGSGFGHIDDSASAEEHPSEHQPLMRNSYAVFCLKKKQSTTL